MMQRSAVVPITLVWLALIAATGISWTLGTEHLLDARESAACLFVVAMIKVRLIIRYFMEVRTAPLVLRLLCDAWVIVVGSGLTGLYLLL